MRTLAFLKQTHEAITHDDDDARAEALGEVFAGVKNALVLK